MSLFKMDYWTQWRLGMSVHDVDATIVLWDAASYAGVSGRKSDRDHGELHKLGGPGRLQQNWPHVRPFPEAVRTVEGVRAGPRLGKTLWTLRYSWSYGNSLGSKIQDIFLSNLKNKMIKNEFKFCLYNSINTTTEQFALLRIEPAIPKTNLKKR